MAERQGQEKTEAPTERKRKKSRDEGQVAFSRELSSAVILAGCTLILLFTSPIILDVVRRMMQFSFTEFFLKEDLTIPFLYKVLSDNLTSLFPAFVPLAISLIALALLASILQVGINFTLKSLAPKFNKISPLTGLKRLFSTQSLADFLKSLFKMVIIGFIGVYIYLSKLNEINGLSVSSPEQIMIYILGSTSAMGGPPNLLPRSACGTKLNKMCVFTMIMVLLTVLPNMVCEFSVELTSVHLFSCFQT